MKNSQIPKAQKIRTICDRILSQYDTEQKLRSYLDGILLRTRHQKTTAALADNSYQGLKNFLCGAVALCVLNGFDDL